jgi:glycosyltransferase involved in cell wall biosynthesis
MSDLEEQVKQLEARIKVLERDFAHPSQSEDRVKQLESRVESLTAAYSRARHQTRRRMLRPPLWTFQQYAPRPLAINPSYAVLQAPAQAPLVAIVTPTRNQRKFIKATIDSVLSQNYPRLTYHVQDGGSNDGTIDVLKSYGSKLTWSSKSDSGQSQAINLGFAGVNGDIMAYLNSDDVLLPDGDGDEIGRAVLPKHNSRALYWADYVPQETLFWRRRVWDAIGPIDETFHYALDWDFILRAQKAGFKFYHTSRFLACFRVHDEQKTAKTYDIGWAEMQRLRNRYLGHEPGHSEIARAILPYLGRQFIVHWMYKCGMLRT